MGKQDNDPSVTCPRCGATRIRRAHRRGFVERIFLRLLWLRPFHCIDCYKRFYSRPKPIVEQHVFPVTADDANLLKLQLPKKPERINPLERRRFSRQRCRIPASVVVGGGSRISGVVSCISLTGCFIETAKIVPVGSEVELLFEVGQGAQSRALVRRSLRASGMGIEFIRITVSDFRRLQDIAEASVRLQ
jgi:PilZ domain